jgi:hypothetical protein
MTIRAFVDRAGLILLLPVVYCSRQMPSDWKRSART